MADVGTAMDETRAKIIHFGLLNFFFFSLMKNSNFLCKMRRDSSGVGEDGALVVQGEEILSLRKKRRNAKNDFSFAK